LRTYLPQVPAGVEIDAELLGILETATDVVIGAMGFTFAGYASAASRSWSSYGGETILQLPYHQDGTLTALAHDSTAIDSTDYEAEADSHIHLYRSSGWSAGRYTATAAWGYGDPPDSIVQVTMEVAVNLWRGRDRGMYTDVIGVEGGGAVGYQRSMTNQQRMVLEHVRRRYGVWGFA
jgi:hypothetical protein